MSEFQTKEEAKQFVDEYILTSSEVLELLDISRSRLNQLIKAERLIPLKQVKIVSLFWKPDVEKLGEELSPLRQKYYPE
ncbi:MULTISPECIES: DNA-binding protein [Bacillus]|uniref:DNA-binding protein n=1 Tax=Bacillus TaxID=1386 RepID=UPI000676E1F0|nr:MULTISPECIES: DNA-binding protein [Bacillus cereus group]AKR13350.1 DNA-binding protein [Bacillus thuringiensis]MCU5132735.1 DNA-binding protein [Bacillus cereus]MCU5490462.1 DNA-binding protein [Bacillus cereus]MDF9469012.1 DNA-binding protein [Bacillus cereus]MED3528916.1 DNA-binding protein [Bacillus thuringiensis]